MFIIWGGGVSIRGKGLIWQKQLWQMDAANGCKWYGNHSIRKIWKLCWLHLSRQSNLLSVALSAVAISGRLTCSVTGSDRCRAWRLGSTPLQAASSSTARRSAEPVWVQSESQRVSKAWRGKKEKEVLPGSLCHWYGTVGQKSAQHSRWWRSWNKAAAKITGTSHSIHLNASQSIGNANDKATALAASFSSCRL